MGKTSRMEILNKPPFSSIFLQGEEGPVGNNGTNGPPGPPVSEFV